MGKVCTKDSESRGGVGAIHVYGERDLSSVVAAGGSGESLSPGTGWSVASPLLGTQQPGLGGGGFSSRPAAGWTAPSSATATTAPAGDISYLSPVKFRQRHLSLDHDGPSLPSATCDEGGVLDYLASQKRLDIFLKLPISMDDSSSTYDPVVSRTRSLTSTDAQTHINKAFEVSHSKSTHRHLVVSVSSFDTRSDRQKYQRRWHASVSSLKSSS